MAPDEAKAGQSFTTRGLPKDKEGWPVLPADAKGISLASSGEYTRWMFRAQPISELVRWLEGELGCTVVDGAGLNGAYNFDLTFSPRAEDARRNGGAGSPGVASEPGRSLADELNRLGLSLVSARGPVEVVVVDHLNRTPTEN